MLHGIGKKGPASSEPGEKILECHGRMRSFAQIALRLASIEGAPADQRAEAAAGARRYFTVALPLHEEDEERSIAPRLLASSARAEIEDALGTMAAQHRELHAILAALDPMWARIADDPRAWSELRDLADRTRALDALIADHLAREEARIVPAIARALSSPDRAAIAEEMRARRAAPAAGT